MAGMDRGEFDALLRERLDPFGALIRQLQGEGWHEVGAADQPAFQNGWTNFGGSYETAAFRFENPRSVVFKGTVKGGVSGATIFTLPSAYWPAKDQPAKDRRIGTAVVDNVAQPRAATVVITSAGVVFVYAPGITIAEANLEVRMAL